MKNGVKNRQAAAYNGACTVYDQKIDVWNRNTQCTYLKLSNCLPWMCEVPFPDWFDNSNGFFRVCFFSMIQASLRRADVQMKSKSQWF